MSDLRDYAKRTAQRDPEFAAEWERTLPSFERERERLERAREGATAARRQDSTDGGTA